MNYREKRKTYIEEQTRNIFNNVIGQHEFGPRDDSWAKEEARNIQHGIDNAGYSPLHSVMMFAKGQHEYIQSARLSARAMHTLCRIVFGEEFKRAWKKAQNVGII